MAEGGFNDVGLESEIVVNKICGVGGVGQNATDFGGGEKNIFRLFFGEKGVDGLGIAEVEFGAGAAQEIVIAKRLQMASDGRTDEAAVAGDENARAGCKGHG